MWALWLLLNLAGLLIAGTIAVDRMEQLQDKDRPAHNRLDLRNVECVAPCCKRGSQHNDKPDQD